MLLCLQVAHWFKEYTLDFKFITTTNTSGLWPGWNFLVVNDYNKILPTIVQKYNQDQSNSKLTEYFKAN